jgi:hypothetical protein
MSSAVSAQPASSALDPPIGTTLTATDSCPAGDVLLAGGAQVSALGGANKVALRPSVPLGSNTWQTVAVVLQPLGMGQKATLRPYVLCGKA